MALSRAPGGMRLLQWASLGFVLLVGLPFAALLVSVEPGRWLSQLASPAVLPALGLTAVTTLVSTALCIALGLPVAYLLARYEFRGKAVLGMLVDLPMMVPPVVVGLALLLAFGRQGLIGRHLDVLGVHVAFSQLAVVLAQTVMASPYFVRSARAGFEAVDHRLEQAAWSLGAGRWHAFRTVTVPLAAPALAAGAVMAWARALSEFGATIMFAGNMPGRTQTLALAVMSAMESDLDTAIAISVIALALGIVAMLAARRWLR